MTVTFLGEKNADGGYGAATTLGYVSTAGSTLILCVASNGDNAVTDTAGNVWVLAGDTSTAGATSQRVGQVYYCVNAAAITSVTITRTGSSNWSLKMTEWAGADAFGAADVKATPAVPSVPVVTDGLALAIAFYFSGTPSYASGYTALDTTGQRPNFNIAAQYQVPAADGAAAPTFGISTAGLVTLALAPAAPVAPPTHFRLLAGGWTPATVSILRAG